MSPTWQAILTIAAAFFGGSIAQAFSHYLTVRREVEKYNKEVYQKLFAPVILDLFRYLDLITEYQRSHKSNPLEQEHEVSERIMKHINENLVYATPDLITSYHEIIANPYGSGEAAFGPESTNIPFFIAILENMNQITRRLPDFKSLVRHRLLRYLFLYRLLYMYMEVFHESGIAFSVVRYKYMFDLENISNRHQKYLKQKLIKYKQSVNRLYRETRKGIGGENNSYTIHLDHRSLKKANYYSLVEYLARHVVDKKSNDGSFVSSLQAEYEHFEERTSVNRY